VLCPAALAEASTVRHVKVDLRDLAGHLREANLTLDESGAPADPLTVVDLERGPLDERAAAAARLASNRVLVGIASTAPSARYRPLLESLDFTLVPGRPAPGDRQLVGVPELAAARDAVSSAVAANPRAALALTRLLRVTAQLPVPDGLTAESATYSMLLAGPEFARWRSARPRRPPPGQDQPAVTLHRAGDVLLVKLDRPDRRNAFSREMRDGLVEAFDLVLADPSIRSVRLSGAGPAFCSGGDLDEFGTAEDVTVAHLIRLERSVAARIHRCRDRVTVRLHGACVGAGLELPSFAGRVTAHPAALLRLPELSMGLIPGAGGTVGITRRIGRWRTAYLALAGLPLDAEAALSWGLIDAVAD
jgi:hypothetical protein